MNQTILETIVGSTLHGTSVDDGLEDLDLMAIVLEDKLDFIGFNPKDTWVTRTKPEGVRSEAGDTDYVAYGLNKYLSLALKGNPTILLALFASPISIRQITKEGRELQALAPKIISKKVFAPFRGYMDQQHKRLLGTAGQMNVTRPELIEKYGFDTKYAGHIIRLGIQGKQLLDTGRLILPMNKSDRDLVVGVRTGKYTLDQVSELVKELESQLVSSYNTSILPENPDTLYVENWMIKSYMDYWNIK
jgi:hypothetical protein